MNRIDDLKSLLLQPKKIAIATHRNPDGDAIGSALGLYHFLKKFGHQVALTVPSEYPHFLAWMPEVSNFLIYDFAKAETKAALQAADIIFCLDFNALERIDKMGEIIGKCTCTKVMIDHHLYPEDFVDFSFSDTSASSTCEMVVDFIQNLDEFEKLDRTIAECLYTGILTDTGSFKYAVSPKLFRTAATLIECGVDNDKMQDLIFNSLDEKSLRILGHCLHNRMEILDEFQVGIITLTKQDYEFFNIQRGDTEGVVNFLLKLKNVKVAAFIHEQPTITKISLRSKGDFSVQEIASQHFKGGGHKNASGGASFIGLEATVRKFKRLLPEYKEKLSTAYAEAQN